MAEFAFFQPDQILRGLRELESDGKYMRALNKAVGTRGSTHQKVKRLSTKKHVPLKYLGIEPDLGEKRFSFADTARLRLQPRSRDSTRTGLKLSNHAQAMQRELPRVAKLLSDNAHFGPLCNAAVQAASFEQSQFAREIRPALKVLEAETGVPVHISLAVLKKGSFAYGSSHRPGMSRFGWARARLSSFLFKGCTYFSPDHLLVADAKKASPKARHWWDTHPQCLCRKKEQCGRAGKSVSADALPRKKRTSARKPRSSVKAAAPRRSRRGRTRGSKRRRSRRR